MESIKEFLHGNTVGLFVRKFLDRHGPDLIVLDAKDTVEVAFATLAIQEIQAAPVFDTEKRMFLGFVDVLDLATFVVQDWVEDKTGAILGLQDFDPPYLDQAFATPVHKVVNLSRRDPFVPIDRMTSLAKLLHDFFRLGIHRVPVTTDAGPGSSTVFGNIGTVIGTVSQSDVNRFFHENPPRLRPLTERPIGELLEAKDRRPAVTVNADEPLIQAFAAILREKISGVGVMAEDVLVGNISASDLRGITRKDFTKLNHSIRDFMASNRSQRPVVTCTPETSLSDVIDTMAKARVHRVHVVDVNKKPVYVVSLTTVMRIFDRVASGGEAP